MVDDGSTDNSAEVALRYRDNPRVSVVLQENMGPERTCNKAIAACGTDYFVRLDADDRLAPDYVEVLLAACERSNSQFAYCDMAYIGAREGYFRAKPFCVWSLMRGNYINASALTRVEAFLAVGGYDEPERGDPQVGFDDWKLYLRLAEHGYRGTHVPIALLFYRRHATGSRQQQDPATWPLALRSVREAHPGLYRKVRYRAAARLPLARWLDRFAAKGRPVWLRLIDKLILGRRVRGAR